MVKLKELKIGKKYRVEPFAKLIEQYGDNGNGFPEIICGFNDDMKKFCGHTVTIIDKKGYKTYSIKEDGEMWAWTSQMLEISPLEDLIYRRRHE